MKPCEWCGRLFRPWEWQLQRGWGKYCSRTCHISSIQKTAHNSLVERFWAKVQKTDSCWLWVGATNGHGYGTISRDGQHVFVHRLAYEMLVGPIPEGLWVLHKCDVRNCVQPSHLYVGDITDNCRDAMSRGRTARGVRHGSAKLDEGAVNAIRALHESGISRRAIAVTMACPKSTVADIVTGRCWKHLLERGHRARAALKGESDVDE